MKLYEIYVQKVSFDKGWPEGEKRLKIFRKEDNAIKFKENYEKRWNILNRNVEERNKAKDIDVYTTKIPLILREVETAD